MSETSRALAESVSAIGADVNYDFDRPHPTIHSNWVMVKVGPTDLSLNFCVASTRNAAHLGRKLPVVAQILIPLEAAEGLMQAIRSQFQTEAGRLSAGRQPSISQIYAVAPTNGDIATGVAERLEAIHEFTQAAEQLQLPPHSGAWSREEIYAGDTEHVLGLKGGD